jgi:hypothetical protein
MSHWHLAYFQFFIRHFCQYHFLWYLLLQLLCSFGGNVLPCFFIIFVFLHWDLCLVGHLSQPLLCGGLRRRQLSPGKVF